MPALDNPDSSDDETVLPETSSINTADNGNDSLSVKDPSHDTDTIAPIHYTCYGREGSQLLHENIFTITDQWVLIFHSFEIL
jgi:hypothetical protein